MQKKLFAIVVLVLAAAIICNDNAHAEGEVTKTVTNYFTTVKSTSIVNIDGEDHIENRSSEELAGNYTDTNVAEEISRQRSLAYDTVREYTDQISVSEGVTDYYYDAQIDVRTEVTAENRDELCSGVEETCEVGMTVVTSTLTKHQTYQINVRAEVKVLAHIDFKLNAPIAGEEVSFTVGDNGRFEQTNAPVLSLDEGIDSEGFVYWLDCEKLYSDGIGQSSIFEGTFEANKTYCVLIYLPSKTGYGFWKNKSIVTVNGKSPLAIMEIMPNSIGVIDEIKAIEKPEEIEVPETPETSDDVYRLVALTIVSLAGMFASSRFMRKSRR